MIDALIWVALMMSLGTSILVVFLFHLLVNSDDSITIPTDKYNEVELWAAVAILCLVAIALVGFTVRKLR